MTRAVANDLTIAICNQSGDTHDVEAFNPIIIDMIANIIKMLIPCNPTPAEGFNWLKADPVYVLPFFREKRIEAYRRWRAAKVLLAAKQAAYEAGVEAAGIDVVAKQTVKFIDQRMTMAMMRGLYAENVKE
jgi:hypothetical protein